MIVRNIIVALFLIVLVGCEGFNKEEDIKIGAILPLTGDNASYGVYCQNGINLALQEFKSRNNVSVKLMFEDSAASPKVALNAVNKLIHQDNVDVILGGMFSSTTMAIAPIAQNNKVLLISPTAADENIPKIGSYIFSIYPSSSLEGKAVAEHVLESEHKKIGIFSQQTPVAEAISNSFNDSFSQNDRIVLFSVSFPEKTKNFRNLIYSEMVDKKVDAVFISSYAAEAGALIRQLREYGFSGQIYSQSSLFDKNIVQEQSGVIDGTEITAPFFSPENKKEHVEQFRETYVKIYGEEPNVWAAYGFDAATLALKTIDSYHENSVALEKNILKTEFQGVTGNTSFNDDRTINKSLQIFRIKKTGFEKLK